MALERHQVALELIQVLAALDDELLEDLLELW